MNHSGTLAEAVNRAIREFEPITSDQKSPSSGHYTQVAGTSLAAHFDSKGTLSLSSKSLESLSIHLAQVGTGTAGQTVATPKTSVDNRTYADPKLTLIRDNVSEWYVNGKEGLHQWFQVAKRPATTGHGLWLKLKVATSLNATNGTDSVRFGDDQGNSLTYEGLKAWDANRRPLLASMSVSRNDLVIRVDDARAAYPITIDPTWTLSAKLTALDPTAADNFGYSVAVSGDTAVVGAPTKQASGKEGVGAVYVFTVVGGKWKLQTKLVPSRSKDQGYFGASVAMSGSNLVVGSPGGGSSDDKASGAAYVFTRTGTTWSAGVDITPSKANDGDNIGASVAINGSTILVGAPYRSLDDIEKAGAVYVFVQKGTKWESQGSLVATAPGNDDTFGGSLSIIGDRAAIGAYAKAGSDKLNAGSVYIFERKASVWRSITRLTPNDIQETDGFGAAVALGPDVVYASSVNAAAGATTGVGAAYGFALKGGLWQQFAKVQPKDAAASTFFGASLAYANNTLAVGAPGAVISGEATGSVFVYPTTTSTIGSPALLKGELPAGGQYGISVALGDSLLLVGANLQPVAGFDFAGAAYLYGSASPKSQALTLSSGTVLGGGTVNGTITLSEAAPAGGAVINLASSRSEVSVPAQVTVASGAKTATFSVKTNSTLVALTSTLTASSSVWGSATATLQVTPIQIVNLEFTPTSVLGGLNVTGKVTLSGNAPVGGAVVGLSADSLGVGLGKTVVIPAGTTSATFTVTTQPVLKATTVNVMAMLGTLSRTAAITINPPVLESVSLNAAKVKGGGNVVLTVNLNAKAAKGGQVINLKSSASSATVPATVTVLEGTTSITETVKTSAVATDTAVQLAASLGAVTKSVSLTVQAPVLTSLSLSPTTITGGETSTATVTLDSAAPVGGLKLTLASNKASATVPATVTVAAGAKTASFTAVTTTVTAQVVAAITAKLGATSVAANLTLNPPLLSTITLDPTSVDGGSKSTATVTLTSPAPAGGVTLTLASSQKAAVIPATLNIAAGATTAKFTIDAQPVLALTSAAISAKLGPKTVSANLEIRPSVPISLTLEPATVIPGGSTNATVTLNLPAPAGGLTLAVSANSALAIPPAKVTVPAGAKVFTFIINSAPFNNKATDVTISATGNGKTVTALLTVLKTTLAKPGRGR